MWEPSSVLFKMEKCTFLKKIFLSRQKNVTPRTIVLAKSSLRDNERGLGIKLVKSI